jgi:protein TonB
VEEPELPPPVESEEAPQTEGVPGGVVGATGPVTDSLESLPVIAPVFDAAYLKNPAPAYPPAAKRLRLQGTAIVRVLVNLEGKPESVRLETSSGASVLDDAAVEAVRHWTFVPARQGSRPIVAEVDVPIQFRLIN